MKIMVGTDLQESGEKATRFAEKLASALSAKLYLVHAADLTHFEDLPTSGAAGAAIQVFRTRLNLRREKDRVALEAAATALRETGVDCEAKLVDGRPWEALVEVAEELAPDLVVVGANQSDGEMGRWVGSTADRVVRHSPCPVVVTGGEEIDSVEGLSMIVGCDFSGHADDAIKLAWQLADQLGGEVILVHAFHDPLHLHPEMGPANYKEVKEHLRIDGTTRLNAVLARLKARGTVKVALGDPKQVVVDFAKAHQPAMVVVGTRGQGRIRELLLGSTAQGVLASAPGPVLVSRASMDDDEQG